MIGKLLLAIIAISCVFAQINEHKISGDTQNFQEITSIYKDTWYSGYLELNSKTKVHYWFFPYDNTDGTSTTQPLLVNLNQGPGCSTMGMTSIYGIGPFVYNKNDNGFEANEYSWNLNANLLFIDAPGIGYSTGIEEKLSDSLMVEYYYDTLQVFLQNYKKLQDSKVYLHGVGYAGLLVPRLALLIYNTNKSTSTNIPIDIAGFIAGNPVTVKNEIPYINQDFPYNKYLYFRDQGFLNWDKWDAFTAACGYDNTDFSNIKKEKCKKIIADIEYMFVGLNLQDIMQDCPNYVDVDYQYPSYTCFNHISAEEFFNKAETKKALHVSDFKGTYKVCNKINYATPSAIMYAYEELILTGMKIWIYSGDQDAEVSFYGTLDWIQDLRQDQGLADLVPYGAWFYKDVLEAGYESFVQNGGSYWKFDGMTFIRFKACGQNAARCNQIGSQLMFKNFILGEDMPTDAFSFSD